MRCAYEHTLGQYYSENAGYEFFPVNNQIVDEAKNGSLIAYIFGDELRVEGVREFTKNILTIGGLLRLILFVRSFITSANAFTSTTNSESESEIARFYSEESRIEEQYWRECDACSHFAHRTEAIMFAYKICTRAC